MITITYQNEEEDKHDLSGSVVGDLRLDEEVSEVELPDHHCQGAHERGQRIGEVLVVARQHVEAEGESDDTGKQVKVY